MAGFVVCLTGVLAYCAFALIPPDQFLVNPTFSAGCVSVIAIGFLLWLVGAIRYFNAAIDAGDAENLF
jgi:hypothetical protein